MCLFISIIVYMYVGHEIKYCSTLHGAASGVNFFGFDLFYPISHEAAWRFVAILYSFFSPKYRNYENFINMRQDD